MTDEQQITALLEAWADNTRQDNRSEVLNGHDAEVLIFDVLAPMKYEGVAAYRASWDQWQPETVGESTFALHDLSVTVDSQIAFATAFIHCAGKTTSGQTYDDWVRATFCLKKNGDKWKIVHQHISMPVNPS